MSQTDITIPSIGTFLFPKWRSQVENCFAHWSPCNKGRTLVLKENFSTLFYRCEDLLLAFISSDLVCFEMTGNICLKSPDKTNVTPPIDLLLPLMSCRVLLRASIAPLCDMVHSSQMIR
uniref:Uncharacterized protein n=1 Tax=Octopus bimaculoides TaxID=37653 RepID=A0A0L8HSC8_OCTBM